MGRMRVDELVRRCFLVGACAPLVLLAGCPQETAASAGKTPVSATAPTVSAPTDAAAPATATAAQAADAAANEAKAAKAQQLIRQVEEIYAVAWRTIGRSIWMRRGRTSTLRSTRC